ncbi:MAG: hypothetical protein LBN93_06440 [Candidatus Symbiothrix sp.]|jgi:hypothetical protein|nr:hypothetical protein [Candidatus Symbiothrix sp.]
MKTTFYTLSVLLVACVVVSCGSAREKNGAKITSKNSSAQAEVIFREQVANDKQKIANIRSRLAQLKVDQQKIKQDIINTDNKLATQASGIKQQNTTQVVKINRAAEGTLQSKYASQAVKTESQTQPSKVTSTPAVKASSATERQLQSDYGFIGFDELKALNAKAEARLLKK